MITHSIISTPCAKVAPFLPVIPLAPPTWASRYHKPSAEYRRLIEDHHGPDPPPASIFAASPNNDLISNKIIAQPRDVVRSPVRFEDVGQRPGQDNINKINKGALTPCSTEDPHSRMVEMRME
jgi:hypothetical protein